MPTTQPPFERLVSLYGEAIAKLLGKRKFWEMVRNPEAAADPKFREAVQEVAEAMAREVAVSNAVSWRQAAFKSTRAREIYEALQAEIRQQHLGPTLREIAKRNAELISSVPAEIAKRITARASKLGMEGARPKEIESEIRKWAPELVKSRVKLIARTEVHKSYSQLTQARAENLGITHYQWATSEDSRVRPAHKLMDNVIVAWDDPPQPERLAGEKNPPAAYHVGCIWNCRCTSLPLADLAQVTWPARVHEHGRIVRMTRAQFVKMAGLEKAA